LPFFVSNHEHPDFFVILLTNDMTYLDLFYFTTLDLNKVYHRKGSF
jgi:hypothetical protein